MDIKKPNILLIEIDCLASEAIFEGDSYTPTIDSLVKDSINFKNTIVSATSTIPSFSSLFTGEFPPSHGVRSQSGYKLKKSSPNLVGAFKKGGYTTYAEVTGPLMKEVGFDRGFDHFNYRDKDDGLNSDWFKKFIKRLQKDRLEEPWFLMLHLWEVHGPRIFPKKFDEPKYGKNAYGKALSYVDLKLKEILDSVDLENTIVAITGDHGELYGKTRLEEIVLHTNKEIYKFKRDFGMRTDNLMPGDHGFHVYDFLVKVPLILHIDGLEGRMIEEQCRSIDILPTLLSYADLSVDKKIDGVSLLPMIKGEEKQDLIAYSESTGSITGEDFSNKFCSIRTN
ncbi:MAG: sulfatase, partial [Thermoplasmatota archaeon]